MFLLSECETLDRNGVCYWHVDVPMTYGAARVQCEEHNGTLAMLTDEETQDYVV